MFQWLSNDDDNNKGLYNAHIIKANEPQGAELE